ncbi:hypothetical protein KGM_203562 [Danaus plexippus plexippus]|uniref:Uncharacterized protein n=1 Tax=Danaus plexippus plexippus TaxID=278856 RepID=A0A212EGQ5_DANPL|nr:hypothetical protein KGM_203562 [Danaus plexippus plexippus]
MVMATEIVDAESSKYENSQTGVWGEHSYARPRGVAPDPLIRTLLAPRPSSPDEGDVLDVEGSPPSPPGLPLDVDDSRDSEQDDHDGDDEDWEKRVAALAPTAGHARLARDAAVALRGLRLERLAGRGGRWDRTDGARAATRRLRRALASHWTSGAAAWLHSTMTTSLPRSLRAHYDEVLAELWRTVPRLAERLAAPRPLVIQNDPLAVVGEAAGERTRPVASVGAERQRDGGCALGEAPRGLDPRAGAGPSRAAHAGPRPGPVVRDPGARGANRPHRAALGGRTEARVAGRGGRWRGSGVVAGDGRGRRSCSRRLVLLAPPLLTAEGPRDAAEEPADEPDLPLLCVSGSAGASCWRSAAAELCRGAPRGACRRVLVVSGADDRLRLPRACRRRLGVPQEALDAAVSEECARWSLDVAESSPKERSRRKGMRRPLHD